MTCSILNRGRTIAFCRGISLIAAGATLLGVLGCYHAQPAVTVPQPPLIVDQAMQQRQWARSNAIYQTGAVKGYSTRTTFTTGPHDSRLLTTGLENGALIGNTVVMPFTLITTPPFTPVVYTGEEVPPSYTAMPPLPPSQTSAR